MVQGFMFSWKDFHQKGSDRLLEQLLWCSGWERLVTAKLLINRDQPLLTAVMAATAST